MKDKNLYLCVTPFFPSPEEWQGAYVLDQVKAIAKNSDFEVIVFKPTTGRDKRKSYEVDGATVHLFPSRQTPSYMFNGFFNDYNGRSFVKKVQELGIDLHRVKYVHTHTGPFAVYGLALRKLAPHIKVFVQHHDLDPFTIRNGKFAQWRPNARYRAKNSIRLFNEVDLHICISTPVKDSLLAFPKARKEEVFEPYLRALKPVADMPSIVPKDVYVLYNGVDTSLFQPAKCPPDGVFRIGCIGNFSDVKDQSSLVKAFHILLERGYTDMRLSLLGSGVTRSKIERYIEEHGMKQYVEWPQETNHDKLPKYFNTLDLFVLPSVFEGFGCVYLEAAACGIPFVCCYNQGASEYIDNEDKDKWLVTPQDFAQLAKKIESIYLSNSPQTFSKSIDINSLVSDYLCYLKVNYESKANY